MMIETYTDRHKALAKHIGVDLEDIDDEDGVEMSYDDSFFWVLTTSEAWEMVYDEISDMLNSEHHTFSLREVAKVLNMDIGKIEDFFLADVLTKKMHWGNEITGHDLSRFLDAFSDKDDFKTDFTHHLFEYNKSGEILCSNVKNVIVDGFHIYCR
jgi:hypothetical protein